VVTYLIVCATIFSPLQNCLSTRYFPLLWVLGLLFNQKSDWQTFFSWLAPTKTLLTLTELPSGTLIFSYVIPPQ